MVRRGRLRVRRMHLVALMALTAGVVATASPSSADVTEVSGSAFGESVSIALFGGAPFTSGPAPVVSLPATGGTATDTLPSAHSAPPGNPPPVVFLDTQALNVSTSGQLGPGGSATSSATVANPDLLSGFFVATGVESTCTSTETGSTGSTTLTEAVYTNGTDVRNLPASPAPNETIEGVQPDVNDSFRVIFNEQVATATSITVNAVHVQLLGPSAVGDIILGQSVCGVSAAGTTPTTAPNGAVTTLPDGGGATPTTVCPTSCPAPVTQCPTGCPTTTIRVGALVRTGSDSDLTIAWAAMALTLGGLLFMGATGVPAQAPREPASAGVQPPLSPDRRRRISRVARHLVRERRPSK